MIQLPSTSLDLKEKERKGSVGTLCSLNCTTLTVLLLVGHPIHSYCSPTIVSEIKHTLLK